MCKGLDVCIRFYIYTLFTDSSFFIGFQVYRGALRLVRPMVSSNLLLTVLHVVSLSQSSMSRLWITLVVDNTQGDSMTIRILQVCYVLEGFSNLCAFL